MKAADMHCDTIGRLYQAAKRGEEAKLRENDFHLDLMKMAKGDYLLQNFAMFVPLNETENPFETAMEMIDLYYEELKKNQDLICPVYSFQDIVDNQANGKMSAMLTLEEGQVINGKLSLLRDFYRIGVRMMTLTWNFGNMLGEPNLIMDGEKPLFHERNPKGLTPLGIEAVQEMERIGIIVDVSHLSDGGFWDVFRHTNKPFVASHSNAYALCPVCRNLTDDMIQALGDRGGVMGLNYLDEFLTEAYQTVSEEELLEIMADHVFHMRDVGGIEVCALGSDYDGIAGNKALPDGSYMERLWEKLRQRGLSENELEKVFFRNVLRVYREILG